MSWLRTKTGLDEVEFYSWKKFQIIIKKGDSTTYRCYTKDGLVSVMKEDIPLCYFEKFKGYNMGKQFFINANNPPEILFDAFCEKDSGSMEYWIKFLDYEEPIDEHRMDCMEYTRLKKFYTDLAENGKLPEDRIAALEDQLVILTDTVQSLCEKVTEIAEELAKKK